MDNIQTTIDGFKPLDDRYVNLINLDHLFAISPDAVIINRIQSSLPDYVDRRNNLVFARAGSLNFVAHCDCGEMTGNINEGVRCPVCDTICRYDFSSSKELEHNTWLSIPPSIPGVLHPIAYLVLANWLSSKKDPNYIDAIIDVTLELPPELENIVTGRGHQYFYDNFDILMARFLHHARFVDKKTSARNRNADFIESFIAQYRSVMFCTKLPVIASILNSKTSADGSAQGRQFADASVQIILDAATDLQHIEEVTIRTRPTTVSTSIHRVYKSYTNYIIDIAKIRLSRKKSLFRRHALGTRLHLSFRAVIIPHTDRYDELYLPWSVSVNLLKLHITSRLLRKYDMTLAEASTRQITALMCYDPIIDQIMKDLINECKPNFPGLPILFGRNPILRRGSIQTLYGAKIKPDVSDTTINISTMVLSDPNADKLLSH